MATTRGLDSLATPPPDDFVDPSAENADEAAVGSITGAAGEGGPDGGATTAGKTQSGGSRGKGVADLSLITLTSEEGDTFTLDKSAAMRSSVIRSMLDGGFEESETGTVHLQIRSAVLEKVVEYLEWVHKYSDASEGTRIPDFEKTIPPELALELLITADFLDV
ncbi:unnamed protein product [Parajaminaea phylloscopi]